MQDLVKNRFDVLQDIECIDNFLHNVFPSFFDIIFRLWLEDGSKLNFIQLQDFTLAAQPYFSSGEQDFLKHFHSTLTETEKKKISYQTCKANLLLANY